MRTDRDEQYMRLAIQQAETALSLGEVPVGAVVVLGGTVVSSGYNKREQEKNALLHAELEAIGGACRSLGTWRLSGCELYVTLEPCPMCAGAIVNSRIDRVIFGASDPKAGACGSVFTLFDMPLNHRPRTTRGVLEDECSRLMTEFFRRLRLKTAGETLERHTPA